MSVNVPDVAAYYFQYKLTVYDNLFVGIVYGEEQATRCCFSSFLTLFLAGIYIVLYVTSVYILL
jgi:hypothetical protein